jgi:hypothetical protein
MPQQLLRTQRGRSIAPEQVTSSEAAAASVEAAFELDARISLRTSKPLSAAGAVGQLLVTVAERRLAEHREQLTAEDQAKYDLQHDGDTRRTGLSAASAVTRPARCWALAHADGQTVLAPSFTSASSANGGMPWTNNKLKLRRWRR